MKTAKIRLKPNNKQDTRLHQCARNSARMFKSCGYCFYCGKDTVEIGEDYVKIKGLFKRDVCCYIRMVEKRRIEPGNYPAAFFFDGFTWCVLLHVKEKEEKEPDRINYREANSNIVYIDKLYKRQARLQRAMERKSRAAGDKENISKKKRQTQQQLRKVQNTIRSRHSGI